MNEVEAIKVAKNKKTTADQLKALLWVSDKVDLLLAKHPNTSSEMLDDLCGTHFLDEQICSAVLAHPNVSVDQLLNSGWEYPSAVFRNPKLPSIMQSQKNFLGEFEGPDFEKSFQKEVPDFVVEWLLSRGKAVYQLAYVSAPKRSPEELRKFRQSKHPKVVAAVLERDVDTYQTWAADVGFEASCEDQLSVSDVRACIDRLVSRIALPTSDAFTGLDHQRGCLALPAELGTVQLRIESTYFKRGRIALTPEQTFYEDFFGVLERCVVDASKLSNLAAKLIEYDLAEVKRFCIPGKKPPPGIDTAGYYVKSGLERSFHRLMVAWAASCQGQSKDYWTKYCTELESLVSANLPPSAAVKLVLEGNIAPPIPPELLDKQGKFDIASMFSNQALEQIVTNDPSFLAGFSGPKFEQALGFEIIPECVVSWLIAKGSFEQQASFLFQTSRAPEVLAKYRASKHPRIVAHLLDKDENTYLAWAQDLGFEMPQPDEDEPAAVRFEVDMWLDGLDNATSDLWEKLVPGKGAANTLQGELVRAIGRLQSENFRNGMMNWGDGSGYYEAFVELVHNTLKVEPTFTKLVKKMIEADVGEIKQVGKRGAAVASGKKSRESAFSNNFLIASDVEKSMQRLGALVGIWCQRHPELVPYSG